MSAPAAALETEPENEILDQFLKSAAFGLKEEDDRLARAASEIHWKARGIWFADYEVVYGYLIRRALWLG